MSVITLIITLAVVGLFLFLVNKYVPMDGKIKTILNIVVVIVLVVWLLKVFGIIDYINNITI